MQTPTTRYAFRYEGGDHRIFVGEVTAFDHSAKEPLLFHGGRYAKRVRVEADGQAVADSLSALVARAYFHLLTPVRTSAAQTGFEPEDMRMLKLLLGRLVTGPELQGDARITRHMDLMRDVVMGK